MLTENDTKYWTPYYDAVKYVEGIVADGAKVLEIGPGEIPFSRAQYFIDWKKGENTIPCDINREKLPFADKEFDFIYCRHVLEDLYNPFLICEEMSRVAKQGYIENPSPLAEICRGVDGGSPPWRGYRHHFYFVWEHEGRLNFLNKYPLVEYLTFKNEESAENLLREHMIYWNSYFLWDEKITYHHHQHEVDYSLVGSYETAIMDAVNQGIASCQRFYQEKIEPAGRL